MSTTITAGIKLGGKLLPEQYYKPEAENRVPKAPYHALFCSYGCELAALLALAAFFSYFFASQATPTTVIVTAIQAGSACLALNPKKGVVYYSDVNSENGQFVGLSMTSANCVKYLEAANVCGDGKRLDVISVLGVTNTNNSQYHAPPLTTGSQGYFSFAPSQTKGLSTQLAQFYVTGAKSSVSFPKPDIIPPAFTGSTTSWYVYNMAGNTAAGAFTKFPATPVSALLYDGKGGNVYDTTTSKTYDSIGQPVYHYGKDFGLSGASPLNSVTDPISSADLATVMRVDGKILPDTIYDFYEKYASYRITDLAVHDGVYYGLRHISSPISYNLPRAVAVDSAMNVYVAEAGHKMVLQISSKTQDILNIGYLASPAFVYPMSLAVDSASNVYVVDSGSYSLPLRKIDGKTRAVTVIGGSADPAFGYLTGVAVDTAFNVYVADYGNNVVRKIDALTNAVTSLAESAYPYYPTAVAVDAAFNVYVTDDYYNAVFMVDAKTQAITDIGTLASPAFSLFSPCGVAVDSTLNVYVVENNLVRKIDSKTRAVTSIGIAANPSFNGLSGVAVDAAGGVYVADRYNKLVRKIYLSNERARSENVVRLPYTAAVFSWDTRSPPSSYTVWPSTVLGNLDVIDSAVAKCTLYVGDCFLLAHAEFSADTGCLHVKFDKSDLGYKIITSVDTSSAQAPMPNMFYRAWTMSNPALMDTASLRHLWGVFKIPVTGTVYYTRRGAVSGTPSTAEGDGGGSLEGPGSDAYGTGYAVILSDVGKQYTALVTAAGTSIVDASKIPAVPGSTAQFLMLLLNQNGFYSMYTYDTFTDTYFSNAAAAATTNVMLAYTWGICNNDVTRSLVEITFSNDYSNVCKVGSGIYYQSPNVYYAIPYACLGIAYDKLLTDCPDIKANMKALVDSTCQASIAKVCTQQYELNPPFSCVSNVYPTPLTVISLAASNTMALSSLFSVLFAFVLKRMYDKYQASKEERSLLSPKEELGALIVGFFLACCGCKRKAAEGGDREKEKEEEKEEGKEGDVEMPVKGKRAVGRRDRSSSGSSSSSSGSSSDASWNAMTPSQSGDDPIPLATPAAASPPSLLDRIWCGLEPPPPPRSDKGGTFILAPPTDRDLKLAKLEAQNAQMESRLGEMEGLLRAALGPSEARLATVATGKPTKK